MESAPKATSIVIPRLPGEWKVVTYAVLLDGSLAILGADVDLSAEWRRDQAGRVPGSPLEAAAKANARLWTFDGGALIEGPTLPLLTPFPVVDRFRDGRWLLASARTLEQPNARVLSSDGAQLAHLHLGDGIMHLKVDEADNIWVGWFDEGVFGNDDWRIAGHEWAPSNYGLVAFDLHGAVVAHAAAESAEAMIADCYALNVTAALAHACAYPNFPIVTLSTNTQTWSSSDLSGVRALAVRLPYVLAVGGYAEESDRAVLLLVESAETRSLRSWRMPFLLGFPEGVALVDGRGDTLHVVRDQVWHRWKIDAFLDD